MKDKDPNDDELNQDEQDNINEADDSFGLPDLDFNTLDEESEEEEISEEVAAEAEAEEEVEVVIEEEAVEEIEDVVEEEAAIDEEEEEISAEAEIDVKRTYIPPKPESNGPKVIGALIVTVIVSIGVWYFLFYRPQAAAAEKAKIEEAAALKKSDAAKAAAKKKEDQRLAAEQEANKAADEDENMGEEATFTTISEPTGRYYIVIESFVDGDMAADYGKELVAKGVSTSLLSPKGKRKFHRLTMGNYGSFVEAQEQANKFKAEFGKDLWVLKY